jgi:RimJ/RimL family protein N-acetyltransferase
VSEIVPGDGFRLRRATADDAEFILDLAGHEDVEPFLRAVRARDREGVLAEIERALAEPLESGRFVIEVEEVANKRSRIANLGGLAIHPDFRGRRLADDAARAFQRHLLLDLDYHRLELEIYGFNERAIQHAERSGFVREGVKRKAYWRHDKWVDGVLFGLVREDLEEPAS